jgi:G3E family GTPase
MTANATRAGKLPVFVLSGFLGAGKTSLLNTLLQEGGLERTAVIVNEFGEIGLDHLFLGQKGDNVIEMSAGCLCCTIRGELATTLLDLVPLDIDRIVIETTGLADPVPVLQAILADREVGGHFDLAGLITLVDAVNAPATLQGQAEARAQVALADAIVFTKADTLSEEIRDEAINRLTERLRELNPYAPAHLRQDTGKLLQLFAGKLVSVADSKVEVEKTHHHHHHRDVNRHGDNIVATVLRHDRPIPLPAIEAFLELIASAHGKRVLRLKGLAAVQQGAAVTPYAVHAVQGVFHEPEPLQAWPDDDHSTRLVAILRDMEPDFIRRLFAGFAGIPQTDTPDRQALTDNPLAVPGAGGPFRRS